MSLQLAAQHLAAHGRGPDDTLVHMSKNEVDSLNTLAKAHGGSLSVNPNTGLPEAGFLSNLLPMIAGGALMATGIGAPAAAMLVGGAQMARTGSLQKGLMAGLGAYGGAGLASGLAGAGASALASESAGAAFSPNVTPENLQLSNPLTASTIGEGALPSAVRPEQLTVDQFRALGADSQFPIENSSIDAAQQSQKAAADLWDAQKGAAGMAPQQLGQTIDQIKTTTPMVDQIKAGLSSISTSPSAAMNFLGDNAKTLASAAVPVLGGLQMGKAPAVQSSGPNPYRYRYEPNVPNPMPQPDVPGYGNQGRNFGKEQRYYAGQYVPYADGGSVNGMMDNPNYPMAHLMGQPSAYATPYQDPSQSQVGDVGINQINGEETNSVSRLAAGGLSNLGGYSDGGRLLRGPGDGVSDSIPAVIGQKQPARLADGEFVVPARIVSELGNGSTEAGARKLYAMMDRVQKARGATVGKGKIAKNTRADKHLPA